MIVKIEPDIRQIRSFVQAALADFDTLCHDQATMVAAASGELEYLLEYLDAIEACNQCFAVFRKDSKNPVRMDIKGFLDDSNILE